MGTKALLTSLRAAVRILFFHEVAGLAVGATIAAFLLQTLFGFLMGVFSSGGSQGLPYGPDPVLLIVCGHVYIQAVVLMAVFSILLPLAAGKRELLTDFLVDHKQAVFAAGNLSSLPYLAVTGLLKVGFIGSYEAVAMTLCAISVLGPATHLVGTWWVLSSVRSTSGRPSPPGNVLLWPAPAVIVLGFVLPFWAMILWGGSLPFISEIGRDLRTLLAVLITLYLLFLTHLWFLRSLGVGRANIVGTPVSPADPAPSA